MKESTAYSYLENRFNYFLRALNSFSFIFFQIFRTAVVLYVPVLAISVVVEVDPYLLLAIIGLVTIATSAFGGFKAVVWSDAVQGAVLLFGILLVLIFALANINYRSPTFQYHSVLNTSSWKFSLGSASISLFFVYNIINALYAYMGSQDVTQRYKGTKTVAQIRQTL